MYPSVISVYYKFCFPVEIKTIDLICSGLESRTIKIRTSMALELSDTYNAQ